MLVSVSLVVLAFLQLVVADLLPISIKDMLFPEPPLQGGKPPSVPLTFIGGVPIADFSIGIPPQNFTGIFDTGAPVTWVVSSECTQSDCANVPMSQKFNRSASTTNDAFDFRFDFSYLDGTRVVLRPELDTVTLADTVKFPRHFISEAYSVDYPPGLKPAANARIGAGAFSMDIFKTGTQDVNNAPLTDAPSTGAPINGIARRAVGDDRFATGASSSGSPTFKKRAPSADFLWVLGSDQEMYKGNLYDLPLMPASSVVSPFWKIPLSGLQLDNGRSFPLANTYGTVSSSSPYIFVPSDLAKSINEQGLGAAYDAELGLHIVQCSATQSAPKLVIQFAAGIDAYIPSQQYISQLQDGRCYSAIAPRKDSDANIELGGPFFRSFYIEYSFTSQKISVANSVANTGAYLQPHQSNTQQQAQQ